MARWRGGSLEACPWSTVGRASVVLGALIPPSLLIVLWPLMREIPIWDQWSNVPAFVAYYEGQPVVSLLLEPYNGQYVWIPRIVTFALGVLTHWEVRCEMVLAFVAGTATWAVLARALFRTDRRLGFMAAPTAAIVFSLSQFENYLSGFAVCQIICHLAGTSAVMMLTAERVKGGRVALALLLTLLASFSHGVGNAVLAAGSLALLVPRSERPGLGVLVSWGAGVLAIVLIVLSGMAGTGITVDGSLTVPFALVLLGKPFAVTMTGATPVFATLGALAVGAFAILLLLHLRTGNPATNPWIRIWVPYGSLGLASAVLVTAARNNVGIEQAFVSHYASATYPLMLSVLVLLCGLLLGRGQPVRPGRAVAALAVGLAVLVHSTAVARTHLPTLRHWRATNDLDDSAALAGTATDEAIRRSLHPDPALVRAGVEALRRYQLGPFAPWKRQH